MADSIKKIFISALISLMFGMVLVFGAALFTLNMNR